MTRFTHVALVASLLSSVSLAAFAADTKMETPAAPVAKIEAVKTEQAVTPTPAPVVAPATEVKSTPEVKKETPAVTAEKKIPTHPGKQHHSKEKKNDVKKEVTKTDTTIQPKTDVK